MRRRRAATAVPPAIAVLHLPDLRSASPERVTTEHVRERLGKCQRPRIADSFECREATAGMPWLRRGRQDERKALGERPFQAMLLPRITAAQHPLAA